jgi:curved DNA-binding protein CbpA
MKTKEYVDKYNLSKGDKFNHSDFVSDLTIDFISLLEVGKGRENIKGFNNSVNAIKMKFDAINNKTLGDISKIWNYFFATTIVKLKEELFPDFVKMKKEEREKKQKLYEEKRRFYSMQDDLDDFGFWFQFALLGLFKKSVPTSSFQVLELEQTATIDDVKSSFRKLSLQHHPDKGGNNEKFLQIVEAKNKVMAYLSK